MELRWGYFHSMMILFWLFFFPFNKLIVFGAVVEREVCLWFDLEKALFLFLPQKFQLCDVVFYAFPFVKSMKSLFSYDSLLLFRPPSQWPRLARAPIAAPTTAVAAAARPAGSNSAKQTSTSAGYRQEPPIMTWSNSASREYLLLCHDKITSNCPGCMFNQINAVFVLFSSWCEILHSTAGPVVC